MKPLERATPSSVNVDSAKLKEMYRELGRHNVHSVMITRHSKVIAEGWWEPYRPEDNHILYSVSKSFVGTAVGFAVSEGKLSIEDRILSVLDGILPSKPCVNMEKLTVRDVLMMSTGQKDERNIFREGESWTYSLLDDFFAPKIERMALMSIRTVLRSQEFALTTVPEPITMPLYVYWRALEERIAQPTDRNPAVGRITLAPMSTFRGLPFKVIIAIGMGENSGFPGNQRFEEFDLMGTESLKRQNDRDSRSDNRNVFLDLFLSARDRFVCSYCVGSDKKSPLNPSPVVVDLVEFLIHNALPEGDETALEAKKRLADSLTAEITLTDTSAENFKTTATRSWKSFMTETLEALKVAQSTQYNDPEPVMLKGPLKKTLFSETIYLEDLLAFFKGRMQWVQNRLGFKDYDNQTADSVSIKGSQDSLEMHILRSQTWAMLEEGKTVDDVLKRLSLDPSKGAESIRLLQYEKTPLL